MKVEAVVRRKTQDMVRDAAEDLLRREVEGIAAVDRADLWEFEVEGSDGEQEVRRILEGTTLVVNPNVHRYSLEPWTAPGSCPSRVLVRVRDRVDPKGRQVLRAIRERLGRGSFRAAARSVLWRIDLDRTDTAACETAGRKILANPHAQDVDVRVVSP